MKVSEWADMPTVEHNSFFIKPSKRDNLLTYRTDGYFEYIRIPSGGLKEVWTPYRTSGQTNVL